MQPFLNHQIGENNFLLTGGRSIFWQEEKILILSDLHLGKAGHFRKSGIGIPQTIFREDMQRLASQIQYFKPKTLLVVGDLFHSTENKEHELFLKLRKDFSSVSCLLVKGNHDILPAAWYQSAGIEVHQEELTIGKFSFTHDIESAKFNSEKYYFTGHIHPGIIMNGLGKQTLRFPCFYFGKEFAVLPAFGKFTGTHPIKPRPGEHVFALIEEKVMKIQ
ncbi:MAG: ligase-associated DNA damage response endonuclease PdeM [Ferruginibacter sp.]|nr:ligase-associated DNA damage response endonuclease PdeM [Ferruginibacter sp.]